jgi:hypothetical protein
VLVSHCLGRIGFETKKDERRGLVQKAVVKKASSPEQDRTADDCFYLGGTELEARSMYKYGSVRE